MSVGKYDTDPNYDDDIDFIKDSDPVQGDPAGTDPENTPLTGPINVIIQKIVGSLAYLKDAIDDFSIERMTDTVFGIGRTATQQEAEDGTAHGAGGPVLTPLRGKQNALETLRSSDAQSNTTRRGTVRRATNPQAIGLTNTDAYLTAALVAAILVHSNAQATASKRGTAEIADQTQGRGGTDNERIMTSERVQDYIRNASNAQATESRRGTVEFANETEAQDENNNTKALTAASLYRTESLTLPNNFITSISDISNAITTTLGNSTTTDAKFFGPIQITEAGINTLISVTATSRETSNNPITVNGTNFNDYTWSATTTIGSIEQVNVQSNTQVEIRFDNRTWEVGETGTVTLTAKQKL